MKILSLQIKNYRNFEDSGVIPYHDLTIFVGENGSGKTSAIDALALLIEYKTPKPTSGDAKDTSHPIVIEGVFYVPPSDESRSIDEYCVDEKLTLRYAYDIESGAVTYSVKTIKYTDDQLNTYRSLGATDLKDFVQQLGKTPGRTKDDNYAVVEGYISEVSPATEEGYVDITWGSVSAFLPVLQRYSSADYNKPENIVSKTLATLYRTHFYQIDNESGEEKLKQDFATLKTSITADLNSNINNQLKDRLSRQLDNVTSVGGDFDIDFARGFMLKSISIDFSGSQSKTIDQLGEGHRKKATLAVLEWDAEVSASLDGRNVIKAYDEPDANLDFPAQRKIFNVINQDVRDNQHITAIICTHSLALIDRAPAESINRVILDGDQNATVEYLNTNDDNDIKQFLSQVAEVSGLRNSNIFYEKAFFVVEGESEEASMGILYKAYAETSLPEDGIVLINIKTNGQWNNILKFLSANKSACTVILLDADTQQASSTRQVTSQKLADSGFDTSFLSTNCFFIGTKEFEDTYSDNDIATMANNIFPKVDGTLWVDQDFSALRSQDKFSQELSNLISREHQGQATKPKIAYEMALLYDKGKITSNAVLKNLFDKLQEIVSG